MTHPDERPPKAGRRLPGAGRPGGLADRVDLLQVIDPYMMDAVGGEHPCTESAAPRTTDPAAGSLGAVHCKERTGLVQVWHAAETQIQQEDIRRHAAYFRGLGAATEAELAAARRVRGADGAAKAEAGPR